MEYGEETLYSYIAKGGLEESKCLEYLKQTLKGFEFLKSKKIYHRDYKPSNLLLKNGVIKIIDLDVSKTNFEDKTQTITNVVGTKIYMDP